MSELVLDANTIGMIAGFISLIAFIPYIHSVLKSGKKPNRASWWIWTFAGILLTISHYSLGGHTTIWVPLTIILGPLAVAIISLKYGEGGWTTFDKCCIASVLVSVLVWFILGPQFTLYINIAIDFLGALPTIRKVYRNPNSESLTAWSLFFIADFINLFAIQVWKLDVIIYPVYLTLLCVAVVSLILRRCFIKVKKTH
ncbi:MAG: hypothetical protein ABII22_04870 [Candidatus Micrarchaeota archaeon]